MRSFQLVLAALLILAPLAGCVEEAPEGHNFSGIEYNPAAPAPDFQLTDQHGEVVSLANSSGKWTVITFGYTHCPDVCNIVSANLKWTHGELGDRYGEEVVFLTITIDPARDTQEHLANFTAQHGYEWQFLTSENHSVLQGVWDDWNLVVDNAHINSDHDGHDNDTAGHDNDSATHDDSHSNETDENHSDHDGDGNHESPPETYEVGHNTVTFILDQEGNKRLVFVGSSWEASDFLEDLDALLDGEESEGHEGHGH